MFKYGLRCELAVMAVAVVCMAGPAAGEVQYTITALGNMHKAYGVNELGQVVGDQGSVTFLWGDGVAIEMGPVGRAYDINESSQVVGFHGGGGDQAFLWEDGEYELLGTLGGGTAEALAINDTGQVAGFARNSNEDFRAYLYTDGVMTDLGTFGGRESWAFGMNNAGQVVGFAETDILLPGSSALYRAFLYDDGIMTEIAGDASRARDINDQGQVVGDSVPGGFLWEAGQLTNLGALTLPKAINNLGQVVGAGGLAGYETAYLWQDGVVSHLRDLLPADSGWQRLTRAMDINDAGQIVGWGEQDNGDIRGFVLTPVPEPSAILVLGLGGGLVARRRRGLGRTAGFQPAPNGHNDAGGSLRYDGVRTLRWIDSVVPRSFRLL